MREYGCLGCSGDLAPLAHCALAVMGEGEVDDHGVVRPAAEALAAHGLAPVELAEKEGLALINGTDGMLGMLVLALHDLRTLLDTADIAAAMSIEGLLGTDRVFAADLQALRPQPGQAASAANMARCWRARRSSRATGSGDGRVQDAYSLRCAPQVHGAARDTLDHAATVAGRELAAAIDNPVGARSTAGSSPTATSTARRWRTCSTSSRSRSPTSPACPSGAPTASSTRPAARGCRRSSPHDPGVDSGLMIAQYTAAAIVSELKRLAVPASVDSIPSSAMQEDHVSMGWAAARKLRTRGRRARPGARDRDPHRGPRASTCARRCEPVAGDRRRHRAAPRTTSPGPAPTATSHPRSRPSPQLVRWRRAPLHRSTAALTTRPEGDAA